MGCFSHCCEAWNLVRSIPRWPFETVNWDSDVSLDLHLLPKFSMTVIINFTNCCWWQSDPFFSAEISAQKCWSVEGLKACRSNLSEGSDVLMVPCIHGLAIGVVSTWRQHNLTKYKITHCWKEIRSTMTKTIHSIQFGHFRIIFKWKARYPPWN